LTDKLSPKQKAVFVLRDLEEVSMPEIAEILSMDPGQVKSNLYYARRKISALIELHYKEGKEEKP
jgi:RNA polymerase sigma-70 factor (ECF subfamily)